MTEQTSTKKDEMVEELTIQEYTAVIGEIPFVVSLGAGQEYAGPPNKKLAFEVSEELGLEGANALMRFASLCLALAKLGGEGIPMPDGRHANDETPLTSLLESSLEKRENAASVAKDQEKENDKATTKAS